MIQKQPRLPSAQIRGKKFGLADQLRHEAQGRADRSVLNKRLDDEHAETKRRAASRIPKTDASGLSGGTMGSTLRASFSGMSRDKGRSARRVGY